MGEPGRGAIDCAGRHAPERLGAADLNDDTALDLIAGYAADDGGLLAVYLGVPGEGTQPHPAAFTPDAAMLALPAAPDLLGTGDFDSDGDQDVLVAALGAAAMWLLPGHGSGALGTPQQGDLPGGATALAIGEINRQDGLADFAIAVDAPEGPRRSSTRGPAARGSPRPRRTPCPRRRFLCA